jgi:hypothetical protein
MFCRYFSRVLFGFAALVFVVLWAWAHGAAVDVAPPRIYTQVGYQTVVETEHPYLVSLEHEAPVQHMINHRILGNGVDVAAANNTTWMQGAGQVIYVPVIATILENLPPGFYDVNASTWAMADEGTADHDANSTTFYQP